MAIATPAGTEYRLQTAESSAWHDEYRKQVSELSANTQRLEMERIDLFKAAYRDALKGVHLTQGQTKEARTLTPCYDDTLPADADKQIVAWFRDGWSSSEAEIKGDARNAGPTSPAIFVFLPAQSRNELRSAIIEHKAAQLTLETRGIPATPEGQDARSAMETRRNDAARRIAQIVKAVVRGAQVYQGGGQTVDGSELTDKLQAAGGASIVRLYGDFDTADQLGWDKVIERARKGETQPLQPIKHSADTDQHPVCAAILKQLGAGKKGSDLRDHFKAPPYGWPQDAVDGALYALVASGHVLALNNLVQTRRRQGAGAPPDHPKHLQARDRHHQPGAEDPDPQGLPGRRRRLSARHRDRQAPELLRTLRDLCSQGRRRGPQARGSRSESASTTCKPWPATRSSPNCSASAMP